jgi:hypothetical protein
LIPDISHPCWRNLASGKLTLQTQFLGLQMILKRQQRKLEGKPGDAALQAAAEELHGFFVKYEAVLANEIKSL